MNKLSLVRFLVTKYIMGTTSHKTLRIMGFIACASISITTFTLALQIFIAQGFEHALNEKMQNIYPDLLVTAHPDESFNFKRIQKSFSETYPEIIHSAPGHMKHALVKTSTPFSQTVVTIKGIDPCLEPLVSNIETKIHKNKTLQESLSKHNIIIGKVLAENLNISIADNITLIIYDQNTDSQTTEEDFTSVSLYVGGIIETGVNYYDAQLIICSLDTMKIKLLDDTISIIGVKLKPKVSTATMVKKLSKNSSYTVDSWQTLYPALVAASKLEKYVGTLLLSLMILVACSTIIGFIFMHITLKKKDIALLIILGFPYQSISQVFISIGMILTISATCIGLIGALLGGILLQKYKWISLPDIYDVTHIPISITLESIFFVASIVIILGFLATLIATYHIQSLNPSHTLRFDE